MAAPGLSLVVVHRLLTAVALLLWSTVLEHLGFSICAIVSVVVACRLSFPEASGIFPDQGSNLCPLHWRGILYHWITGEVLT